MPSRFMPIVILMLLSMPALGQDQPAPQADVPVKIVVLYSSGVGYFEHFGSVTGDAQTELRFKTEQINDILKSLVLQDLDRGTISTITYPSQNPLEKTLRSFEVDLAGNPSLAELLNQLRGAEVKIKLTDQEITGTILGVESMQIPSGQATVERKVLNVLTGASIRAVRLDEVRQLDLTDTKLRDELHKALAALSSARDQDKKPVAIQFRGEGQRRVRIGYVIETPIWKTSYRLILPSDGNARPNLQGWAIVENQTDGDWNDVQLGLVSGRPISFVMDLYQSLYVPRPTVELELFRSLRPPRYTGGLAPAAPMQEARQQLQQMEGLELRARGGSGGFGGGGVGGAGGGQYGAQAGSELDATDSIQAMASGSNLGELFQYTIPNVKLARQSSAMLPIVTDAVDVERVSIYNENVLPSNPLNGAILKNTTGKHFLQGPITVLEGSSYAGDAQIENLPPGQSRLLSWGIDLKSRVDATELESADSILTGKIVQGVLELSRRQNHPQDFVIENKGDATRTYIVEVERFEEWSLVDSPEPMEKTEKLYRFKMPIDAGKQAKLTVTQQQVYSDSVAILPADIGDLQAYVSTGPIPQKVKDVLAQAIRLKQAIAETERGVNDRNNEINAITTEQNRIRENMRTVERTSQYYTRLLSKLDEQETRIETLRKEIAELQTKLEGQRGELAEYLKGMNVG